MIIQQEVIWKNKGALMALYSYEAFSKEGKKIRGIIDASSIASVKKQLSRQELFPITITLAQETAQYGIRARL